MIREEATLAWRLASLANYNSQCSYYCKLTITPITILPFGLIVSFPHLAMSQLPSLKVFIVHSVDYYIIFIFLSTIRSGKTVLNIQIDVYSYRKKDNYKYYNVAVTGTVEPLKRG